MIKPLTLFNRHRRTPLMKGDAPNDPLSYFYSEMNRVFDDFFDDFGPPSLFSGGNNTNARAIHMDVKDKGKTLVIEAELPGVEEDDIDVSLHDNLLTIRGERKLEQKDDEQGISQTAFSQFHRSMTLPFDVDPDAIEARIKNGVLKLTFPKPPELEAKSRKIAITKG